MSAIWRSALWTAVAVLTCVASAHAELAPLPPQPADVPWPTSEWPTGPLPEGVDRAALDAAMADAFGQKAPGLGETREVAIIVGGKLVHEQYGRRLQSRHEAGVVVDGEVDHAGAGRRGRQAGQGQRRRADGQSALGRERQARTDPVAHLAADDGRHALPGDRGEDDRRQRRIAQSCSVRDGWTSRTTAPACR